VVLQGPYHVEVRYENRVEILPADLEVDFDIPVFTRIRIGEIVTDAKCSFGCSWGDYDDDGWPDLFVATGFGGNNCLYHNDGDGTFSKLTAGPPVQDGGDSDCGVWGDYDNDGDLDLFVTNFDIADFFYRNDLGPIGQSFMPKTDEPGLKTGRSGVGAAWGDFDGDGLLDLYVANAEQDNFLYRNAGNGELVLFDGGPATEGGGLSNGCSWADYDNDADLDLFVANNGGENFLFRNDGSGEFTRIEEGGPATDVANSLAPAWGDYDNDGDLDLVVANHFRQNEFLYENNGDGTFTTITHGPIVTSGGSSLDLAWGDLDNDGYLDLFVANHFYQADFLFHNQRNGTFWRIQVGDLVSETGLGTACAWADYDNDGDLDLFVANGPLDPDPGEMNYLFRNEGNANGSITVKLIGSVCNRDAIGAKVRLSATIWGKATTQLREISGGSGHWSQNDSRAHFGLGDAEIIDTIRIEWPGPAFTVQELHDVPVNQLLTITEPLPGPVLLSPTLTASNRLQFTLRGEQGQTYQLESSPNLENWTEEDVVILEGSAEQPFEVEILGTVGARYYRVVRQGD
jgi:hypothetical protein